MATQCISHWAHEDWRWLGTLTTWLNSLESLYLAGFSEPGRHANQHLHLRLGPVFSSIGRPSSRSLYGHGRGSTGWFLLLFQIQVNCIVDTRHPQRYHQPPSQTNNPPNPIPSHPPKPLPKPNPQPPLPAPPHQHLLSHPHNLKPPPPRPKRLTRRRPRQKPRRPLPPNPPRPPPRAHHLHPSQMPIPLIPRRPRRNRAGVRSRGGGREDVDLCCCCQLLPPKYGGKGGDEPPSDTSVSLVVGR